MVREEELLDAAARVLAGDHSASMVQIAAGIGTSRATLSRRYATREALLKAVAARAIEVVDGCLAPVDLDGATADGAAFDAALEELVVALLPAAHLYGFTSRDATVLADPAFRAGIDRQDQRALAFLALGQRLGRLRADLPPYWIWYSLWGLLDAAAEGVRDGHLAPREIGRLVLTSFLGGARPPWPPPAPAPAA
ncbi:TetR/AcrR family transcriptional regulator [Streptomyces sp. NBC_00249]|uniref:TetR/AcrR family transcriptional regulator n=1 Tax=Streptomyces sp. NBC_00249 TaxID=2975690 RepID=UPI0022593760|nr:TetR/AcrR family transcriptional regulator [Streptomyces sp. NBC_00249]MCX5192636.1 TetR/AcrR family transcriptional regulator [Streptomyces sp. NBC_00249]